MAMADRVDAEKARLTRRFDHNKCRINRRASTVTTVPKRRHRQNRRLRLESRH